MIRYPVVSTSLRSVGYNAEREFLDIEFQNGGVYRYFDVPPDRYRALLAAPSHGRFFNSAIRGAFQFVCQTAARRSPVPQSRPA